MPEIETPKGQPKLHIKGFSLAEHARNVWHITPEEGTSFDAVCEPGYWVNVAKQLQPGDILEVLPEGMPWLARLIIGSVETTGIVVAVLEHRAIKFAAAPAIGNFAIEWRGPRGKYAVVNQSDKTVAKGGFENKDLAAAWIGQHLGRAA